MPPTWVSSREPTACHPDLVSEQRARDGDRVHLSLPARPAYARVARIGAASLAHRWGFPPHQVQDLRLAVDEAIILFRDGDGVEFRFASDSSGSEGQQIKVAFQLLRPALP